VEVEGWEFEAALMDVWVMKITRMWWVEDLGVYLWWRIIGVRYIQVLARFETITYAVHGYGDDVRATIRLRGIHRRQPTNKTGASMTLHSNLPPRIVSRASNTLYDF
jgi:hypothetical protein